MKLCGKRIGEKRNTMEKDEATTDRIGEKRNTMEKDEATTDSMCIVHKLNQGTRQGSYCNGIHM